jgi:hypothetical protein
MDADQRHAQAQHEVRQTPRQDAPTAWRKKTRAEGEGKMTVRILLIVAAIGFSATAFAQSAPPKVGNKPLVQVKPKEPAGCKLVGTVKGTKLWAGDCVASELRGATETKPLSEQDIEAIPPGQKQ